MSDRIVSTAPPLRPTLLRTLGRAAAVAAMVGGGLLVLYGPPRLAIHPHVPKLGLLLKAPPAIQLHLAAVAAAIGVGAVQLLGAKGARLHRVLGWAWVVFMMAAAASALFVHVPTGLPSLAGFTPLHLLSVLVLVQAPLALIAARRHRVAAHAGMMTGLYVLGLGVAGLFAFVPGRLLWAVVFG